VRAQDTSCGYGWISISLHWLTAAIVITMFTIGVMSQSGNDAESARLVRLHTTIGVTIYVLLWARIIWRFKLGHPGPLPRQGVIFFSIGKYFHFLMLIAIGVMLLSGPLMVWTAGDAIQVFSFGIPSPLGELPSLQHALRSIHGYTASFILAGMVLHVLAVFKHTIINRDGTFDKIMIAARSPQASRTITGGKEAKA
jgi:cytochrome b561